VPIHDISMGIAALGGVLGLIWLIQRAIRAGGFVRPQSSGRLKLVQSLALDARRRLVLVECDGCRVLLLTGGANDLQLSPGETP